MGTDQLLDLFDVAETESKHSDTSQDVSDVSVIASMMLM